MAIPWCDSAPPGIEDVRAAAARLVRFVHRTPVVTSRSLDALTGAHLFFKCENLQRGGAFKVRGAFNAVLSLSDAEVSRGVATHSSGNHGAALAMAAAERGIAAFVVVPTSAPRIKRAAIERNGATIIDCAPSMTSREATLAGVLADTGACYIAPFDDPGVIAGQGTVVLELLDQAPELDEIWVPVGGGGLASGAAIAAAARTPGVPVIGAEPANADDACRSLASGVRQPMEAPDTVADGLRTSLSPLTFGVLASRGVQIALASEARILDAQRLLMERTKLVVEPSAAVPLAALLDDPARAEGRRIGMVLSGGNTDLTPGMAQ